MTKKSSIVTICILSVVFLMAPVFVIIRTINIENGWKGLPWGATEQQTKEWVEKNNNKSIWNKCNLTHFGVSCYKLTWKETKSIPFEYIEFQFKNGKLCAVIETYHEEANDPAEYLKLNRPKIERGGGQDLGNDFYREKGNKYKLTDRVFYYTIPRTFKETRIRHAVERLVKNNLTDTAEPESVISYQLTTAYYSLEYFEEAKNLTDNFPSHRFLAK